MIDCYRVHIPFGSRVPGATADGEPTWVLPGQYLVHRLRPRSPPHLSPVLRFVGADPTGHDVHVALGALRKLPGSLGVALARVDDPAGKAEDATTATG